jgi:hypothetical protein
LFDKRRRLMNDWAAYCEQPSTPDITKVVVPIGARRP